MKKITLSVVALALLSTSVTAAEEAKAKPKRTLKGNMMEVYNMVPSESTDGILGMLTQGQYYGRLRSNSFLWDWEAADSTKIKDNRVSGLGGSLIYKTAKLGGLSFTAGAYYSHGFTDANATNIGFMKAGKDTLSRYNVKMSDSYDIFSVAQYYAQYDVAKTSIKIGQQIWESLMTKSNDTKMIPNTFMGASIESKDIADTTIRAFYFTSQKLRDHDTNHDFVTFGDGTTDAAASWNNNDDSAVNKSLSYKALTDAGMATDHDMNGADVVYKGIKDLKVTVTHNMVPEIVFQEAVELDYKIKLGDMTVAPAVRVIGQKDLTGGKIAGAASLGNDAVKDTVGYKQTNSLSSYLAAGRVVVGVTKGVQVMYGISYIADMADMMAMWRGFPTGGYTRAMAQYNWFANTMTNMVEAKLNLGQLGLVPGMNVTARYAMQDFDDNKTGVQADTNVIHVDVAQNLDAIAEGLSAKFRLGMGLDARNSTTSKSNAAYNEYRFEVNYLF